MDNLQSQENNLGTSTINRKDRSRKAITGFTLGLIGVVAWIIPIIGAPITIIGLIFSILGLKSLKHGLAIAGIVLCVIGLVATIVNGSIGAYLGATGQHPFVNQLLGNDNQDLQSQTSPTDDNDVSKSALISQTVQEIKVQLSLPYQLDQVTTLTDITAEPAAVRYHYVLSGIDANQITNELLRNNVLSGICKNGDTKNLLNQDINMEYSYSVDNSTEKYFFSITKTDCK